MSPGSAWWLLRPCKPKALATFRKEKRSLWDSDSAISTASDPLVFAGTVAVHLHGAYQVANPRAIGR